MSAGKRTGVRSAAQNAVDDEHSVLDVLSTFLVKDGYEVETFDNGDDVMEACEKILPDLVVMDIMMPGTDGLSACSGLRNTYPSLPIILISAKDTPYDRVTGLTIGADDYLCKPFLPIELIARIRALLRRCYTQEDEPKTEQTLSFGQLVLYLDKRTATLDGERFPLTPNEFDFLAYLIKKNGAAASREELINNLWKVDWQEDTRVADDLVKRLRRKLHVRNASIQIKTVWGYGFRLSMGEQK